jgi:hypothetical protein
VPASIASGHSRRTMDAEPRSDWEAIVVT